MLATNNDITDENVDVESRREKRSGCSPVAVRHNNYYMVQQTGVWDKLTKQYEAGYIGSLAELSAKIKEQTGVDISTMTLSRRLRSSDKQLVPKRKYAHADLDDEDVEKDMTNASSSSSGECYRSLSRRLCATMMTVAEDGGVRQYTRTRVSSDGLKEYFRCNRCYFQKCKTGGGIVATVAAYKGHLVGNKHPKHHEKCELVGVECAAVTAVDRESRLEVRAGQKDPREAHNEAFEKTVQLASSLSAPPGRKLSMTTMFPSFSHASMHNAKNNLSNDVIMREVKKECGKSGDEIIDVVGLVSSSIPQEGLVKSLQNSSRVQATARKSFERFSNDAFVSQDSLDYRDDEKQLRERERMSNELDMKGSSIIGDASISQASTSKTFSGRRHYVIRNPITGRIIACNSTLRHVNKNKSSVARLMCGLESSHLTTSQFLPDTGAVGFKPHDVNGRSKRLSSTFGSSVCLKMNSEISTQSEEKMAFDRIKSFDDAVQVVSTHFNTNDDTSERDQFDRMGESVAHSLRGVYEVDADAAARFQSELLQVMSKYEKTVEAKQ
ncbi:unnamed protein product [Toxocara canis]|uniref:HTH myb-type domain-containing protein n=1 Tax=Toxocara canis TaxID=6265 RepID=A0A183URC7_TOXCA|nr:unnamed protein product [Toxocara canis]